MCLSYTKLEWESVIIASVLHHLLQKSFFIYIILTNEDLFFYIYFIHQGVKFITITLKYYIL